MLLWTRLIHSQDLCVEDKTLRVYVKELGVFMTYKVKVDQNEDNWFYE